MDGTDWQAVVLDWGDWEDLLVSREIPEQQEFRDKLVTREKTQPILVTLS